MEVTDKDIETLQRLQVIDVAATNAQRELDLLPQRAQLAQVREKQAAVLQKKEQLAKLEDTNRTELSRVGAEIEILSIRQEETQKKIEDAGIDFRAVESLSKDLNGMQSRVEELESNREAIAAREGQIGEVKKQVETALHALAAQESKVAAELEAKEADLQGDIDASAEEHGQLIATLPDTVAAEYERARKHCGGVALSTLDGSTCTTCRSTLEESRLLQVRHQAPLGVCPQCHRLMIIR